MSISQAENSVAMDVLHTRESSLSSSSSTGASYHLVLEHVLSPTGSFHLTFDPTYDAPRSRGSGMAVQVQSPNSPAFAASPPASGAQLSVDRAEATRQLATARFVAALMNHVSSLPSQTCSLSPSYISSFVRKCFPLALELVDFPQSLAALEYLRDLETLRKKEIAAALSRVGFVGLNSHAAAQRMSSTTHPGVIKWAGKVLAKEGKIELLYEQVWIALRRWILVNEMSLQPFNKHNALAMLNTLLPPPLPDSPSAHHFPSVPSRVIHAQREVYFKYIRKVEKKGARVLEPLMQFGKAPDSSESTAWPTVARSVDLYLRVATSLMDECFGVTGSADFDAAGLKAPRVTGLRRRTNSYKTVHPKSGKSASDLRLRPSRSVSSLGRPRAAGCTPPSPAPISPPPPVPKTRLFSMQPTFNSAGKKPDKPTRPYNPTPPLSMRLPARAADEPAKRFTTLEKIAREIRKIKERHRLDVAGGDSTDPESGCTTNASSMATSPSSTFSSSSPGMLRRLRSMGDVKDGHDRSVSSKI